MWIARDIDNRLRLFRGNPTRCKDYSVFSGNNKCEDKLLDVKLFFCSVLGKYLENNTSIVLTKYLGNSYVDYNRKQQFFINMLKNQDSYKGCSDEELEEIWQNHLKEEYNFDEILDTIQCDGYTKVVFKKGKHDCQHEYVCETKEYIDEFIKI